MKLSLFIFLTLLGVYFSATPAALADGLDTPDREQRRGMSREEYMQYRKNMRMQMEKMKTGESATSAMQPDDTGNPRHDNAYGKGYQSRAIPDERPAAADRPERSRAERAERIERREMRMHR